MVSYPCGASLSLVNQSQQLPMAAVLGTGDAAVPNAPTPPPIVMAATRAKPELVDVPQAVFPDTPKARAICADAYLEAGVDAERSGYSGIYINTVGDYGIGRLRQAASVPVTGAGEGGIHAAMRQADRFAIISIWPPQLRFIYDAVLAATGTEASCVAIHHLSENPDLNTLGQPDNFLQDMKACGLTTMARIREACRQALGAQRADVVLLGCTCMQPVAAPLIADDLPVVEPMVAGYKRLEALISEASR